MDGADMDKELSQCAIICCGTSVRDCDLSRITCPTIGVNWSFWGMKSPIHVLTNGALIQNHGKQITSLLPHAREIISGLSADWAFVPKVIHKHANPRICLGTKVPKLPDDYSVYRDGWVFAGGGPCALQVAVSYGYKRVIFVGLDLYTDKDHHFYSNESKTGTELSECSGYSRQMLDGAWAAQLDYFKQTIAFGEWEGRGIEVLNVGRYDGFRRVRFEEVFSQ